MYDATDEELVNRLVRVAREAGLSSSGLIFDAAAGIHSENVRYLQGVVLARLARVKPSYTPGDVVAVRDGLKIRPKNSRDWEPALTPGSVLVVSRVWYAERDWYLEFKGVYSKSASVVFFPATSFMRVTSAVAENG